MYDNLLSNTQNEGQIYMNTIINRLRNQRIDHDMTQAQVAEILGISQQYYSLYEKGVYDLPLRHF